MGLSVCSRDKLSFFFFSFVVAAFSICVAIKKKITRYTDDSHQLVFQALEKKRLSEN